MGDARLADDIVRAGEEGANALQVAVLRGDAGEDWSQGHALADDPSVRTIQERFLLFAARDLPELRVMLRSSSDAAHRALAALVLGYAADKPAVVEDLVHAMSDPSTEVRNNAMRSLLVFAGMRPAGGASVPQVPAQPFIEFLGSLVHRYRSSMTYTHAAWSSEGVADPGVRAMRRVRSCRVNFHWKGEAICW